MMSPFKSSAVIDLLPGDWIPTSDWTGQSPGIAIVVAMSGFGSTSCLSASMPAWRDKKLLSDGPRSFFEDSVVRPA